MLWPHHEYTTAYIDNVVAYSTTWQDHLHHLRKVLAELRRVRLTADLHKCNLGLMETQYLGYHIGQGLLKPQESKVETVKSHPCPTTKCQVTAFLGLVGYYIRFVPNFFSASPYQILSGKVSQRRSSEVRTWNRLSKA